MPHGGRTDHGPAGGLEFAHRRRIERMDRGTDARVQRGIKLAPFAAGHHWPGGQTHRRQHRADHHRVGGKHLAQQGNRGAVRPALQRRLYGTRLDLGPGIFQHRPGQHILGLGMSGNSKARHVDADDAHTVYLAWQQLQRHARGGGHTKVGHHHRIIAVGIGQFMHRIADIFEQLAGDQGFRIERHIAHRAARAVEMRHEGQAIDTAGRTRQHRRHPAHPQADAQRPEGGAHGLRFVMRSLGVIGGVLIKNPGLAGKARGLFHFVCPGMAAHAIHRG